MITASHLPYQRNGFKFFTAEGGLEHADIEDVLSRAAQAAAAAGVPPDNEFLGTAYVMTMALGIPAGLISQVCCAARAIFKLDALMSCASCHVREASAVRRHDANHLTPAASGVTLLSPIELVACAGGLHARVRRAPAQHHQGGRQSRR